MATGVELRQALQRPTTVGVELLTKHAPLMRAWWAGPSRRLSALQESPLPLLQVKRNIIIDPAETIEIVEIQLFLPKCNLYSSRETHA